MKEALLIAAGGAIGAICRWLVAAWIPSWKGFPLGILLVNVTGCLFFGICHHLFHENQPARLFLLVGVLGGYTTFSTFGWDTAELLREGKVGTAMANALLSTTAGVGAIFLGIKLTQRL